MALWTYLIDAYNVNDGTKWLCEGIPELDEVNPPEHISVPLQDDYPMWVRDQPQAGRYTQNLAMAAPCTAAQWTSRIEELKAVLTPGPHTLTVQARGMTATKTVDALYNGMATNYKERRVSIEWWAPNPNFV